MKHSILRIAGPSCAALGLVIAACATGGADDPPGSGGGGTGGADAALGGSAGSGGTSRAGAGGTSGGAGADAGADVSLDAAPADAALDVAVDSAADSAGDALSDTPGVDAAGCSGTPPVGGCPAGQYFHVCKNSCVACSDFTLVGFPGAPKLVPTLSDTTGGTDQLFPRIGLVGTEVRLVFSQRVPPTAPTQRDFAIAKAQGNDWASISTSLGNFVNYPSADEEASFLIPAGAKSPLTGSTSSEALLLMDSDRSGSRELYVSGLFKSQGSPAKLAAPVNSGSRNYHASYAHAATPARLFWSSFRNNKGGLYTWALSGGSADAVSLTHESGCPVIDEDLEPAVTADGRVMVFSAPRRAKPDCNTPLNAGRRSLFYVYLNPLTGQALAPAVELANLRTTLETVAGSAAVALRSPALEPNACTLYFASNAAPGDGDFDIYRVAR